MPIVIKYAMDDIRLDPRRALEKRMQERKVRNTPIPQSSSPMPMDEIVRPTSAAAKKRPERNRRAPVTMYEMSRGGVAPAEQMETAAGLTPEAIEALLGNPVDAFEIEQADKNRRRREIETMGRQAARESLSRARSRAPRSSDDYVLSPGRLLRDEYEDRREMAHKAFELGIKDKNDRDAWYRGQSGEVYESLFDQFDPENEKILSDGWAYSANQKHELQRLQQDANDIMGDPRLTEEERYRALQQILAKKRTIRPNKVQEKQPGIEEQWEQEAFPIEMPDGSKVWISKDRNGAFREVTSWKPEKQEAGVDPWVQQSEDLKNRRDAYQKAFPVYYKMAREELTPEGTNKTVDPQKIIDRTYQLMQEAGIYNPDMQDDPNAMGPTAPPMAPAPEAAGPAENTPEPQIGPVYAIEKYGFAPEVFSHPIGGQLLRELVEYESQYPNPDEVPPEIQQRAAEIVQILRGIEPMTVV